MPRGDSIINDADEAYNIILDAIVTQQLAPSQKVSENILSDTFGISRTIARNLIERLIAKHFLVSISPRVTQVTPLTLMEIKQNFALRKMILPSVIAMAAPTADYDSLHAINDKIQDMLPVEDDHSALVTLKANRQLNLQLCSTAGYPMMYDWVKQLEDMTMRIYWLYIKIQKSFPYSSEYQQATFEVMKNGGSSKTQKAILDMLTQTEERILNAIFAHDQFYTQDLKI
ncbi:GntR family transcriptional regulator [Kordiimonas aquimaris]|uniref:GntR family transcriptional regulator n=1 Tax=Kordiimonas aquimaris TaxID=707591 RepID=UPI0021D27F56|nr:GntR family transcriptional regulator [Kordiimonas aquimaris]